VDLKAQLILYKKTSIYIFVGTLCNLLDKSNKQFLIIVAIIVVLQ